MNEFFQSLNWGFPYHIILALILFYTIFFTWVIINPKSRFNLQTPVTWSSISTFTIGLIYEIIQRQWDFAQDLVANFLGLILAILILILYDKNVRY